MEFHLPDEVTQNITAYMPKDKDMFSPTAAIVKQAMKISERLFMLDLLATSNTHDLIDLTAHETESGEFRICLNLSVMTEMLPTHFHPNLLKQIRSQIVYPMVDPKLGQSLESRRRRF